MVWNGVVWNRMISYCSDDKECDSVVGKAGMVWYETDDTTNMV